MSEGWCQAARMQTELLLDHETILANQAQPVHFALRFTADAMAAKARQPAAFCVVLDRSGSMEGAPLTHALTAARTAIKHLRKQDHFALVAFDDTAHVVLPLQAAQSKAGWPDRVKAIRSGGSTNLTAGWMLGRDELAKAPLGCARRLLLLTDGQLNVGITDPMQVKGIVAAGLEQQGVRTSCLGFGDEYDECLLGKLAKAANGDFHDAGSPEQLPAIFTHELDGLQALAVQNLRVRLKRLDFCERIFGLNDYPFVTLPDGRTEIAIGDLVSEEERVAVFALEVLPLPLLNGQPVASLAGETLLEVELAWDELSASGIASKTWSQVVRVQATQNPAEVKANEEVLSWVAVQRAAKAVKEAANRATSGDEEAAKRRLAEEIAYLEAAGNSAAVSEALATLVDAQAQMESSATAARKAKLMFSLSHDSQRQSSRRRPDKGSQKK